MGSCVSKPTKKDKKLDEKPRGQSAISDDVFLPNHNPAFKEQSCKYPKKTVTFVTSSYDPSVLKAMIPESEIINFELFRFDSR